MAEPFKFLHASDLHLDQPMQGLTELPPSLKRTIANAPYDAAKRLFDLALTERVDFVLLAGDVLDIELGGCRPAAFLLSQFERLAEKNISVYWCGGVADHPERWPTAVDLPDNVILFCSSVVEEASAVRQGRALATIVGCGHDPRRENSADFLVDEHAPFPIGLTHGVFQPKDMTARHIRYWALGGQHRAQCVDKAQEKHTHWFVYSGTTQSRSPLESGSHGCQLVQVDSAGTVRVKFHPLDSVRWMPQKLAIAESASQEQIRSAITERALKLVSESPDTLLLVDWQLTPSGAFHSRLRKREQCEDMLEWMRRELTASADGGIWSVDFRIAPPTMLPESWLEEDTMLGDYLRAIGRYQEDDSLNLALHEYLPPALSDERLLTTARIVGADRKAILSAAAMTGIEYLAAHRDQGEA